MALTHCDTCTLTELCPIVLLHSRPVGQRHRPLGQRTATRWGCRKVANGWTRSVSLLHECERLWLALRHVHAHGALPHRAAALSPCWTTSSAAWPANSDTMGLLGRSPPGGHGLFRCCTSRKWRWRTATRARSRQLCPIVLLQSRSVGQRHRPLGQRTATRWGCRKVANEWKRSAPLLHKYEWRWAHCDTCTLTEHLPHRAAALSPCWTTSSATWPANSDTMGLQECRQRVETVCFAVARVGMALAHCDTCTLMEHCPIVLLHSRPVGQRHRPRGQRTATRWGCRCVGRSPTGGNGLFRCCTSANGFGALRHVHAHGALPHRAAALSPCWTTSSATWPTNSDTMGL